MKKNYQTKANFLILGMLFLLTGFTLFAQAPNLFNYQAVIRDAEGNVKANQQATLSISILQGAVDGSVIFTETHSVTSNSMGLVNLQIGSENPDDFVLIDWATGPYFISISVDGVEMGTSQLLSVPYAKYADFAKNTFSGDYEELFNKPEKMEDCDPDDEIQSFRVSPTGDTLYLSKSNWVIIPGISAANYADENCPKQLPDPELSFEGSEEYSTAAGDFIRYKLNVENYGVYPDFMFKPAPELPPCGLNENASRTWVEIYDNNGNNLYGFCALSEASDLNSIWFSVKKGMEPPSAVYIVINDRLCEKLYTSNKVEIINPHRCGPVQFLGNWVNTESLTRSITKVSITESGDDLDVHMWGACVPTDCDWGTVSTTKTDAGDCILELTWKPSFAHRKQTVEAIGNNMLEVVTMTHYTDGSGRPDMTTTDTFIRENICSYVLPDPEIILEGFEEYMIDEKTYVRYMLDVVNFNDYPDELFEAASDLPPCGSNTNSSRAWVDIYDGNGNRIYGFCALGGAANLNDIWFAVESGQTPPSQVYIVINDRRCENEYTSNKIDIPGYGQCDYTQFLGFWVNEDPNTSGITKGDITESGENLAVQLWGKCHPTDCDWGSVTTAKTDAGDCILELTWVQSFAERTQTIEFITDERIKVVTHTHFTDGSGRADYTKTEYLIKNDACSLEVPTPVIAIEGTEEYTVSGNVYIRYKLDVTNHSSIPDELFAPSPDLPPCGMNTNSARAWVDIYNGDGQRLYGFCALGSAASLNDIWFAVEKGATPPEEVYIVIDDRRCDVQYKSNTVNVPSYAECMYSQFTGTWMNENSSTDNITKVEISSGDSYLHVNMWGKCTPSDCDWGIVTTSMSDADDCELSIIWEFSFAIKKQVIKALQDGRLEVYTHTHFIDDSGRVDYEVTEYFSK